MIARPLVVLISLAAASIAMADAPPVRLLLPATLYATPGLEANLYFENVVLVVNPANYVFDVDCGRGIQQAERWTYTPAESEVGQYSLTLRVLDQASAVVAEGSTMVAVRSAAALKEKAVTALIIGDSLTNASVYSQSMLDVFARPDTPTLTLVGSYAPEGTPANRHEGLSGWTAARFATFFAVARPDTPRKKRSSPFIYKNEAGETGLDFARYCAENNGGVAPDMVTIFLGCNDTFNAKDDSIESVIDTMFTHMNALIGMIHGYSPTTKIGLIAPVPPAATQDPFGQNYKSGQTRWQYRRNQHRTVERMTETYGGREAENLILIPAYVNLDCYRNYPQKTVPANGRTEATVIRLSNGVHPAAEGYRQIGDSISAWLVAMLAEG